MVELEFLEGGERTVARLEQLEPPHLPLVEIVERVGLRLGLPEKRKRDHDDAGDGKRRGEHQSERQRVAGRPTVEARATRRRCSRRSGHSVITEPRRNTSPASQMRLTSGLTKTLKYTVPFGSICSAITKRSSPVSLSLRMPTSFETCCSIVYAFLPAWSEPRSRSPRRTSSVALIWVAFAVSRSLSDR